VFLVPHRADWDADHPGEALPSRNPLYAGLGTPETPDPGRLSPGLACNRP